MKYTSALVIAALLGANMMVEETQAVKLNTAFSDDLIKSLTEDMQKENEQEAAPEAAPEEKPAEIKKEEPKKAEKKDKKKKSDNKKKDDKKSHDKKKDAKKPVEKKKEEPEEIPMDAAAIKAYSSVIADAAVDSEPSVPVQYHEVMTDDERKPKGEPLTVDPMGSMIQNEISDIKDASIKASQDN
jgi:outer membrane biosynthesis protein TonB